MTTATDVIAALNQRRLLRTGRLDAAGRFPAGWQGWFDALEPIDTAAARAHVEACVAGLAQRPPPLRGQGGGLGAPFFQLLRRTRPPDPREDRGLRIGAGVADLLLHIVLLGLLLWLMYLRFLALSPAPEEEQAVQVEFIGRGNAVAGGGALANAGAEAAPAAAASRALPLPVQAPPAASASAATSDSGRPQLEQQALPPPPALQAQAEAPARLPPPQPVQASAAQELAVSNVPQPAPQAFQLPPPREHALRLPDLQPRDVPLQATVETLPNRPVLPLRTLQPAERALPLRAPELKEQVQAIEVFTPDTRAIAHQRAAPAVDLPLREPQLRGQVQALPLREGQASAVAAGGAVSAQPGAGSAASGTSPARGAGAMRACRRAPARPRPAPAPVRVRPPRAGAGWVRSGRGPGRA
ncbi:hypothetical protein LJB71_07075 [Thermomonas sp. S9]|uniref:hypothetical protein n=1 Tax=Thermomonas sp. S9 TaxID=2885203 RepID=UPI00216B5FCC|nr:hypothetical protein [Thermomonas sp. S9]MCR6496004.1 hypothetical protein [Thermomonas sp. S9]